MYGAGIALKIWRLSMGWKAGFQSLMLMQKILVYKIVQNGCGAHTVCNSMDTIVLSGWGGGKAAGV